MTENEYLLGEDVTELAQSKKQQDTVVVSVRVSRDEFKRLEEMANRTGKSISQIVRDSVSAYCVPGREMGYSMAIGTSGGSQCYVGGFQQDSFVLFEPEVQPSINEITST